MDFFWEIFLDVFYKKSMHFPCNIQHFASLGYQFLHVAFFIFQKNHLKIYFGILTKFPMQLRKFSMLVVHCCMQSEIELWLYFIHFKDFFIMTSRNSHLGQFSFIMWNMVLQRIFSRIFVISFKYGSKNNLNCTRERSNSILFGT